jgi:putative transposase
VTAAIEAWASRIGEANACAAFGVSDRVRRRARQAADGRLAPRPSRASGCARVLPAWRIPDGERDAIVAVLCEPRFCDLAPAQIYHHLLDDGVYLCSIRQMYRLLNEKGLVSDRRRGHKRTTKHPVPQLAASAPNQVWSWDISRLAGPAPRVWFYLYVIVDIYSRKLVGWTIDDAESDKVARRLINATAKREHVATDQLTLHSDRGAQMTSITVADLLESLGVTRSFSRPRVSNDNPYSEAAFKTVKYQPSYPARFADLAEAKTWMRKFVDWYNAEHYHSGIGHQHPNTVHDGGHDDINQARQQVLDDAYAANADRFRNKPPIATPTPGTATINHPVSQSTP